MERPAILYVTNRALAPDPALRRAVRLAQGLGASVTLLQVCRERDQVGRPYDPLALERLAHTVARHGVCAEVMRVGLTRSWSTELAELDWSRWVVAMKVPDPDSGMLERFFPSVDQCLARTPGIPVWFVPAAHGASVRVIMACVDVSDSGDTSLNANIVHAASDLAAAAGAGVVVFHSWSFLGESIVTCPTRGLSSREACRVLRKLRARRLALLDELATLGQPDVPIRSVMVRGLPDRSLRRAALSLGADALVLGTTARRGVSGALLGNLAERFMGHPGMAVLVLKKGGRVPSFDSRGVAA